MNPKIAFIMLAVLFWIGSLLAVIGAFQARQLLGLIPAVVAAGIGCGILNLNRYVQK
ncbi:MAG: hypothetical protein UX26_C0003G0025 [Parcubacteria group bacterium GW2011_GWC1_45_9]|nr:MAG: hypothetical protein UW85_C0005G0023 [Parcubacteria group bacterium GW2011_GWA1_Parcubacteria_45_10]KKT88480.1 MAG: hypothetical protein UW89_C0007G0023 [Parcubacteria group bacterium GW2011_GWB1_45_10]KKU17316.1 MAG: hypothetical protein UX26_C0003G0025 [Parcubacteria group bacterium GW2011_GWC1_45_9]